MKEESQKLRVKESENKEGYKKTKSQTAALTEKSQNHNMKENRKADEE